MALSDFGEYIAYEAAFSMQVIDDPLLPIDALANVSDALATKLRALAAIALLVNADSDGYFHNLIRAGITRVVFLTRLRSEGITSHHHDVSGRFDAVIDSASGAVLSQAVIGQAYIACGEIASLKHLQAVSEG